MLRFALVLLTLLATAAPASAAESFLGVLDDGRAVRFTDEAPTALTQPLRVPGLRSGDRIVALAPGFALGRSGTVYVLLEREVRVRETVARIPMEGRSWSVARMPGHSNLRVFASTGREFVVNLGNFSVSDGDGLRLQDGTPVRAAVTALPDGRLVGIDATRGTLVTETGPFADVVTELRLTNAHEPRLQLEQPLTFSVAGGSGWLVAGLPGSSRRPQSRLIQVDLASGRTSREAGPFFFRRLRSVAPLGTARPDTTPPRVTWRDVPSRISLRRLARNGGVRFSVRCSEACIALGGTGVGGRTNAVSSGSRDTAGTIRFSLPRHSAREIRLMRLRLGRTIKLRVFARDWAGNSRTYDRDVRLVR
jgi:hypothetical protein